MKKLLALFLTLVLCASCGAIAEESTPLNTLTVGVPMMNGDFIDGFGNSAYDNYIKVITGGYCDTIATTPAGQYVVNEMVVKEYTAELDAAGNKVYTFILHDDIFWNDGSPITAQDYVFYTLWAANPKWAEAGASSNVGYGLLGYDDYNSGKAESFAGVRLINDKSFAAIIDAKELPYFFENTYVALRPKPIAVWAPGATIETTDAGSKIVIDDLKAAMDNISATERFAPTVTCGPFSFVSFENQTVTMQRNPYSKGDLTGKKPQLEYIVQKYVAQDTDVDGVIAGDIDLVFGAIEGRKIEAAKASQTAYAHSYFRNGYGYLAFHCDWGVTADPNVRWALGYLLDRNEVIDYVLGGYGGTVHAEYGYAQWMYEEAGADLEEILTPFNLNFEKANELLDLTEWKFEADGTTPFDAAKANAEGTYMRHNAAGDPLVIRHLGTEDNEVTDIIEIQYSANAPMAGVKFELTRSDFSALLDNFYYGYQLGEDRYYNTFNLATSFDAAFDPYINGWHSDWFGSWENSCQLSDEKLDEIIMRMRSLEPSETDKFVDAWLEYEVRWQELLPQIPLYSNEYFDIANNSVGGLVTTPFAGFRDIVCDLYKIAP